MSVILFILQPLYIVNVVLSNNARGITAACLLLHSVQFGIIDIWSFVFLLLVLMDFGRC